MVRVIGTRREPELTSDISAESLRALDELNRTLTRLGGDTFIPKGVYRFRSHADADEHQSACIARGMAARGLRRR